MILLIPVAKRQADGLCQPFLSVIYKTFLTIDTSSTDAKRCSNHYINGFDMAKQLNSVLSKIGFS